jgi:hypothetical protein
MGRENCLERRVKFPRRTDRTYANHLILYITLSVCSSHSRVYSPTTKATSSRYKRQKLISDSHTDRCQVLWDVIPPKSSVSFFKICYPGKHSRQLPCGSRLRSDRTLRSSCDHIIPNTRTPAKIEFNSLKHEFQAGRPPLRWSDCTETDLKSMGVQRWRKKAEDRSLSAIILEEALVQL